VTALASLGLRLNRTLKTLSLHTNSLTMVSMQILAKAVRSNTEITLKSLNVADNTKDAGKELNTLWLGALEGNGHLLELVFDIEPLSDIASRRQLRHLLVRNLVGYERARQAALAILMLHRFRRQEFSLGPLLHPIILYIAQLLWHSRGEQVWWS
jgi:hypothetical protein